MKVKKVTISVTTEDNVTMKQTIPFEDLDPIGVPSNKLNNIYLELVSELNKRYGPKK